MPGVRITCSNEISIVLPAEWFAGAELVQEHEMISAVQGSWVLLPHQNLRLQVLLEASPLAHSCRRMAGGKVPQSKSYAGAQSDSPWSDQFLWRFPISIRLLAERSVTAL